MGYGHINEIGYVVMHLVLTKFRLFAGGKMDRKGSSLPGNSSSMTSKSNDMKFFSALIVCIGRLGLVIDSAFIQMIWLFRSGGHHSSTVYVARIMFIFETASHRNG